MSSHSYNSSTNPRTIAREVALAALYQADITDINFNQALENALSVEEFGHALRPLAEQLVLGFEEHQREIDKKLSTLVVVSQWDFYRLSAIDRNLLRLGAFEIDCMDSIPEKVTLSEYIQIANKFGSPEQSKFIHGVLAQYLKYNEYLKTLPEEISYEEQVLSEDIPYQIVSSKEILSEGEALSEEVAISEEEASYEEETISERIAPFEETTISKEIELFEEVASVEEETLSAEVVSSEEAAVSEELAPVEEVAPVEDVVSSEEVALSEEETQSEEVAPVEEAVLIEEEALSETFSSKEEHVNTDS